MNFMKKIILSIITFLILTICTSCGKETSLFYRYEYNGYLDTLGYIIVEYDTDDYSQTEVSNILSKVENLLLNIEKEFSISQTVYMKEADVEESTLMLINKRSGEEIATKVSDDFLELLTISQNMSNNTNGLFDASIGSLTKVWNISSRAELCMDDSILLEDICSIPSDEEINTALELVNYQDIQIDYDNKTVLLPKKGMALDFGGIAKGFAAEKIAEYLLTYKFSYAVINMGGNVKIIGDVKQDTDPLRIYVKNPFGDGNIGYYYPIVNTGGVTSGIYERYISYKGTKYHHILNPKTGYPSRDTVVSVTIMGENSAMADALSTGVFMMGLDKGLELINSLDGYEAIIITKEEKVYVSNNLDFIKN